MAVSLDDLIGSLYPQPEAAPETESPETPKTPQAQRRPQQAYTGKLGGPRTPYDDLIYEKAIAAGQDPNLIKAQIWAESNFNPKAVSPKDARGLTQFIPGTWARYGKGDPFDPSAAIDAQLAYNADLGKKFGGNTEKMLAAYNWGENRNALKSDLWKQTAPPETRDYVNNILQKYSEYSGGATPTGSYNEPQQQPQSAGVYELELPNGGILTVPNGMDQQTAIAEAAKEHPELAQYLWSNAQTPQEAKASEAKASEAQTSQGNVLPELGGNLLGGGRELVSSLYGGGSHFAEMLGYPEKAAEWQIKSKEMGEQAKQDITEIPPEQVEEAYKEGTLKGVGTEFLAKGAYPLATAVGRYGANFIPGGAGMTAGKLALEHVASMGDITRKARESGVPVDEWKAELGASVSSLLATVGLPHTLAGGAMDKVFGGAAGKVIERAYEKGGVEEASKLLGNRFMDVVKGLGTSTGAGFGVMAGTEAAQRAALDQPLQTPAELGEELESAAWMSPVAIPGALKAKGARQSKIDYLQQQKEITDRAAEIDAADKAAQEKAAATPAAPSLEEQARSTIEGLQPKEEAPPVQEEQVQEQAPPVQEEQGQEQAPAIDINHAAYQITRQPAYETHGALAHDDALFELEVLQDAAKAGKLTPIRFANSEIGQRLDASHITDINGQIKAGDFSALDQLVARIHETKAQQEAAKPPPTPETPKPYYEDLGLSSKNNAYKALAQLDVNNPEHHATIVQVLEDAITNPRLKVKDVDAMTALRDQLQPKEAPSAEQIPETGAPDGGGVAQPQVRKEGRGPSISGEGVEPSGQRIETPEIKIPEEKIEPPKTPEKALKKAPLKAPEVEEAPLTTPEPEPTTEEPEHPLTPKVTELVQHLGNAHAAMRELTARKKAATAAGDTALISETNTKIQSVEGLIRKLQTAKKTVDTQIKSDLAAQTEAKAAAAREEAAKKVQEQGGYEFDLIEPEVKPAAIEAPKPKPPKAAAPTEDADAEALIKRIAEMQAAKAPEVKIAAKGEPAENAHTPDTLRVALSEKYGKNTPKLEVSTREAEGVEPDVKGFYDPKTKRVVLIADNIGKGEDIHGLLRHEVAVHAKRLGKTDPEFQKILDHLQALKEQGNQQVIDAYNRVPKDTKTEKVHEEALAYLSQHAPNLPIVKRFMSWMRRTAYKITGRTDWLKAEDFGPMADAILKRGEKVQTHGATAERMYARRTTEDQERVDRLIKKAPSSSEEFATNAKDAAKGVFKVITDSETRSDLATKTRQQLTAQSAPIAKALQKLETFGESTGIRADLLRNQMDGVGHLFANALRMGAPDISEGGMMKIKADPKLALHKWFTDSDKLDVDQDNAMAVLRVLMGEQWAKESGAGREKVAQYRDYAATLKAAAKTATGKDKTKYTKLADGLIEEAKALEERHGEAPMEGLEKLVSPEDIKWAHDLLRRSPKLQEWVDRTHAINREAVDFLVKSGVLDKETAADWKSRPYIPLFKSLQDLKDQQDENLRMFGGSAKSLTTRKAIKGGTHQVNVPENMLRSWMQMYTSGYKNHVRATAVKQMRLLGEVERTHKNDPLAVLVKRDGKNEYWKVPDKGIAQSLEMGPLSHWVFNDLTSGLVNTLRFGAIKNPVYWVRSITREPLTANFTSRTGFVNPATTLLHTMKALVGISPESKELFKYGTTGYAESQLEPENFSRAITKTPGYKKILDTWNHIHSSFDAATRVSVFNQAKKEGAKLGLTGEKLNDFAAMKASEFANFSTKGANQVAREMGRMTPFFNASLNSLDNLARNATGMHLNAREKAQAKELFWSRAVGTAYMTGLYTLAMLNDPKYRNASDSEWTMNYFMPSDKEDRWTPVAAGFEPAFLFKFIPELLIRTYTGNLTPEQATGIGAEVAQSKMLPPMMPMLPALMAQLAFGYDINLGREVEGVGAKRLPAEYRDKGASEIAKKLVQDYDLGKLGVSPVKMDALGRGVMGELYNMSAMMADLYLASKEGISLYDKDVTQKYPVAKAIYTNPKNVEKAPVFYEAAETAEQMVSVATRKASRGFAEQYNKIWTDPESKELLRIAPQLRQFRENIQRLDKSMETLENTKMPEAERQLRYNDMLRVRNGFIQQGAEVYEESKRKLKKEAAGR